MTETVAVIETLCETARMSVLNRPRWLTLERIEKDTGLTQSWVSQFARCHIPNPGIDSVVTIYKYMKGLNLV